MKFFISLFLIFLFSSPAFSMEDEVVFELKRFSKKNQTSRKKTIPEKFKRTSFSYNKEYLVFNEKPKSSLKKGTVLKVNIPYSLIASFSEEFPVYGIVLNPFQGILSGKIKGVKNTNKALVSFDEIIIGGEAQAIESFPVFLEGDLKESLFKDIALNFFESLPSILSAALQAKIPPAQIHFINSDLKNKIGNLSSLETQKRRLIQYLEIKNIKLLQVIVK